MVGRRETVALWQRLGVTHQTTSCEKVDPGIWDQMGLEGGDVAVWIHIVDVRYVLYVFIIHTCRVGLVINNSVRKMGLSTIKIEYQKFLFSCSCPLTQDMARLLRL